jgi:hypothetical protein
MIPNGSVLTYVGTWHTTLSQNSSDILSKVGAGLTRSHLLVRSSVPIDAPWMTKIGLGITAPFTVTIELQIDNGLGYGSENDVIQIVRHWVYDVTGSFPETDSIPYKQLPDLPGRAPTGQPVPTNPPPGGGCVAGTSNGLDGKFSISCWFDNLTTKGLTSVGFIALLVLLGFGLLIFARPAAVAGAARRVAA